MKRDVERLRKVIEGCRPPPGVDMEYEFHPADRVFVVCFEHWVPDANMYSLSRRAPGRPAEGERSRDLALVGNAARIGLEETDMGARSMMADRIHDLLRHEVDEWLAFDGIRWRKPHPGKEVSWKD